MPEHIRRIGGADLDNNPYYNKDKFVGKGIRYKNNKNFQCIMGYVARACEVAEAKITYYTSLGETEKDCKYPLCKNRAGYGNAVELWNDTAWDKTTNPNQARLGDGIVYGKNWGNGFGHIRTIEAIYDDYFICSGANEDGKGNFKFDIKVPKQVGSGDKLVNLVGYVHNPFITNQIENKVDYEKLYKELRKKVDNFKESV